MFKPSHNWFYPSSSLSPQFLRIPIVTEFSHVTNQFLPITVYPIITCSSYGGLYTWGTPTWMVYFMENPIISWMTWGYPYDS